MTTYKEAGVNRDAAALALKLARGYIEQTHLNARVRALPVLGGFSGFVELPGGLILGISTDGAGAKALFAALLDSFETLGVDIVAANVNDIAVTGIMPSIFVDYIGTGRIEPEKTARLLKGMANACTFARVDLSGGETAEQPAFYKREYYHEIVGTAVGYTLSRSHLVLGDAIQPGMSVYGFPSSGLHTNGFHLVIKVFGIDFEKPDDARKKLGEFFPEFGLNGLTLGEELLRQSEIYTNTITYLRGKAEIAGLAHITGGGLVDNLPRVLPDGCAVEIWRDSWKEPPIFRVIKERGNISDEDMNRTLNRGIGLVAVSPDDLTPHSKCFRIGRIIPGNEKKVFFV